MAVSMRAAQICVWVLGFLGIAILIIGIIALSVFPSVYKKRVHENLALADGKETFENWKKAPIPVSFTIFLFNVTNAGAVQENGAKPILEEVGPFVFRQQRSKEIIEWDNKNNTVTYNDIKSFYFIPELSEDQDAMVYMLNIPLMGIFQHTKDRGFMSSMILPALGEVFKIHHEELFVFKKARELLFDGYKVKALEDILNTVRSFTTVDDVLPNNTFGFFYGKNNTGAGKFTVYTGVDDITKFCQIYTWDGMRAVDYWNNEYCNMINGTDGSQFAPPVTKYESLYVFTPEICRSVFLDYVRETDVHGILTYRFMTPASLFASDNPNNKCYCLREDLCDVTGILDISSCRKGVPLLVSAPHFYKGHEWYTNDVHGLNPSEEEHETYVDIEPTTGVVLRASRKLQMNFLLERNKDFPPTANLPPKVLLPLMWIREEASIDEVISDAFTAKVKTPVTVAKSVLTACIVLGILWIAIAAVVTFYIVLKQKRASASPSKASYRPVPAKPEENGEKSEKVGTEASFIAT